MNNLFRLFACVQEDKKGTQRRPDTRDNRPEIVGGSYRLIFFCVNGRLNSSASTSSKGQPDTATQPNSRSERRTINANGIRLAFHWYLWSYIYLVEKLMQAVWYSIYNRNNNLPQSFLACSLEFFCYIEPFFVYLPSCISSPLLYSCFVGFNKSRQTSHQTILRLTRIRWK